MLCALPHSCSLLRVAWLADPFYLDSRIDVLTLTRTDPLTAFAHLPPPCPAGALLISIYWQQLCLVSFHVKRDKNGWTRTAKRRKVPKCVVTGTHSIDRYWQSLQRWLPSSVNSKAGVAKTSTLVCCSTYSVYVWRSTSKDDCDLIQELETAHRMKSFQLFTSYLSKNLGTS